MTAARAGHIWLALSLLGPILLDGCVRTPPGPVPQAQPFRSRTPDWARRAVFYEIFPRSFQDSDGDGIGDLRGLTARLDYLNDGRPGVGDDLQVDALWLMPIMPSPSDHGYDVTDFRAVHPELGTLADLDRLLDQAHRRGMRVLLDLPLNHTSVEHPWFRRSRGGLGSRHRSYYVWRPVEPGGWRQPWGGGPVWHFTPVGWYYGLFWSGMPDLNYRNRSVQRAILQAAGFWLRRGVDGFRLDAVRYLVETGPGRGQADTGATHRFLRRLADHCHRIRPDCLLIGEAWTDTAVAADYFGREQPELDALFSFDRAAAMLGALKTGDPGHLLDVLEAEQSLAPEGALWGTFLSNHDQERVASRLAGQPGRLRAAAALLLTLPGAPFVYYGEEIGTPGCKPDPALRLPMPWTAGPQGGFSEQAPWRPLPREAARRNVATQLQTPDSLLAWYRRLIRLRQRYPSLSAGSFQRLVAPDGLLVFLRSDPVSPPVAVAQNLTGRRFEDVSVRLPGAQGQTLEMGGLEPWGTRVIPFEEGVETARDQSGEMSSRRQTSARNSPGFSGFSMKESAP